MCIRDRGNDDAIRAVALLAQTVANAILEGKQGESFYNEEEGAADYVEGEADETGADNADIQSNEAEPADDAQPQEVSEDN